MPFALEFENISKEYRRFTGARIAALESFSLEVHRGEIFGFLGPNGAGKTTAIHLAMGFMRPTSGQGTMLGQPFGDARTRRRVGFLAENVALYHRPAGKLVRFYGALNGIHYLQLRRRCREVLKEVGLDDVARRNAGKFSRGMVQRLGLAQALINDPELLVLDEPTSALDPLARVAVRELLLDMRAAGKTVFLSSHLLSEIETVCDRVAFVRAGRVIRVGRTADLLESRATIEIIARGVSVQDFPSAELIGEEIKLVVPRSEARPTIERIWRAKGEVVRVNPTRRSLEQMFVELSTGSSDAPEEVIEDDDDNDESVVAKEGF